MFTELSDALLVQLKAYQSRNILLKYLAFEPLPCSYLLKFTKLVDLDDIGISYQVNVNKSKDLKHVKSLSLPPDDVLTFMYDPTTLFVYSRDQELFGENTIVTPRNIIKRLPNGTLGSCQADGHVRIKGLRQTFSIFEYMDNRKSLIKKVTSLSVESVVQMKSISLESKIHSFEQVVELPTDVFNVRCLTTDSDPSGSFITTIGRIEPKGKFEECEAQNTPMPWKVPIEFDFTNYKGESLLTPEGELKSSQL